MLRVTIKLNHNIDIANYGNLKGILKARAAGFVPKKSGIDQRCRYREIFKQSFEQQIFGYENKYENKIHHGESHKYNLNYLFTDC